MSNQQVEKVKVKRLACVGLWSTDISAQARFYHQTLGFDLHIGAEASSTSTLDLEDANLFLSLGGGYSSLGLFSDTRSQVTNGSRQAAHTQLHHLSFEVDTDAELAALAARLKASGIDLSLGPRYDDSDQGHMLWMNDPDGNRIEISVTPDDLQARTSTMIKGRQFQLQPESLQHIALNTIHLETMINFYTDALGFDISDWLLRECAWLRCNANHHTLIFMQGTPGINHIGYSIAEGSALLGWADHLSHHQIPILWGPGRHGAGNDLFLRIVDTDGIHIELSSESQQYYDRDVSTPPRLWHTRSTALNLWGVMPSWIREQAEV